MKKRCLALLLCLMLSLTLFPTAALAAEPETGGDAFFLAPTSFVLPEEEAGASSEELFSQYVQAVFQGRDPVAEQARQLPADVRAKLGERNYAIEQRLKAQVARVANGETSSTEFAIDVSDLDMSSFDQEDFQLIYRTLIYDCVSTLFWHDVRLGMGVGGGGGTLYWSLRAASDFRGSDEYTVNASKIASVKTAFKNAVSIVNQNAGKSDYNKLLAYKEAICKRNVYNDDAAGSVGSAAVGTGPWQLVYVFDGDTSTNVVCEGYAKAFQYLCDLSSFSGGINAYCVAGDNHMWNIVTMEDGRNYVVDVTWDDQEYAEGGDCSWFIIPAVSGTPQEGYVLRSGWYDSGFSSARHYDSSMFALYSTKDLTLSKVAYGSPYVTTQPASVTVPAGGTATFKVVAPKAAGYRWQYRTSASGTWANADDTGCTTATLKVDATAARNGYQYRCRISNDCGTVFSSAATLSVAAAKPTITKQPANASAAVGGTAVFSVTATGATGYQWQFRRTADGAWANATATGNNTATLKVPVTASKNGYQYRCKVSGAGGTVYTSVVTLTVQAKPSITKQPVNASAAVGGTAVFSVTATGATSYQWQFRRTDDGAWANASASGNKTATLNVPVTANKNGYQYRCKVSNAHGSVFSSVVTLTVQSKPSITKQPANASAPVGGTAVFSVTATGATSYQWQFRKSASGAWANAGASGNQTATLSVPAAASKNGYQYRCKVSNAAGTVYTNVVTLTVQSKPVITVQPTNASAPVGGTAVFSVTASGATSYQWQFRRTADGAWGNATASGNQSATLNVPVTANKNGYQYRCVVTNAAGTVYTSVVTLSIAP